ncbi:MAG TPA: SGNH/GDSL hydrolase family protein [Gaiellaceae bacterium]|nr:SGNH/GDSL hydrolase family protein [Gaiellaceae bacterium]
MAHRTVLCFGDSNTYGSIPGVVGGRFDWDVRWPGVLARELAEGWRIIEEGLPGRTTVFDDPISPFRRGADYLPPCLGSHAPLDVVVIFLGTNDLKARLSAGPSDMAEGVGVLVQMVLDSASGPAGTAPRVIVLGLPRLGAALGPEFDGAAAKAAELPGYLAEQTRALGVDLLDLSQLVTYSAVDGFHLDPEGHATIGRAVAGLLRAAS